MTARECRERLRTLGWEYGDALVLGAEAVPRFCARCGGEGHTLVNDGDGHQDAVECPDCDGTGGHSA